MIVYDLTCAAGHGFEGWFGSAADFSSQQERGVVACPMCGTAEVTKAPMAPAVGRKGNQQAPVHANAKAPARMSAPMAGGDLPAEVRAALAKLAEAQAKAITASTYVGKAFSEESRAMHYGEKDAAPIHGEATLNDAKELMEEGIAVAPLLVPVAKPDEIN